MSVPTAASVPIATPPALFALALGPYAVLILCVACAPLPIATALLPEAVVFTPIATVLLFVDFTN